MQICYQPIGIIYTPFDDPAGMPIQPAGAQGVQGRIKIFQEFLPGLQDLDGFSHVFLLYHLNRTGEAQLKVKPFLDTQTHGIFATRAPRRPNPIGLSVVRLLKLEEDGFLVENIDVLNGTPLLDIKPYVPVFDQVQAERIGWLSEAQQQARTHRSDDRFLEDRDA